MDGNDEEDVSCNEDRDVDDNDENKVDGNDEDDVEGNEDREMDDIDENKADGNDEDDVDGNEDRNVDDNDENKAEGNDEDDVDGNVDMSEGRMETWIMSTTMVTIMWTRMVTINVIRDSDRKVNESKSAQTALV